MSGKTPDLPALGGVEIGRVIVKAISSSSERFQTADEFMDALNWQSKTHLLRYSMKKLILVYLLAQNRLMSQVQKNMVLH